MEEQGAIELSTVVRTLRARIPDVSNCDLAESISRLHRRGIIRIAEEPVSVRGELIRKAVLSPVATGGPDRPGGTCDRRAV